MVMINFAIMVYHYSSWTLHPFKSDSVLGVLGIYGVGIFYILSGLTLFVVYHQKLELSSLKTLIYLILNICLEFDLKSLSLKANTMEGKKVLYERSSL